MRELRPPSLDWFPKENPNISEKYCNYNNMSIFRACLLFWSCLFFWFLSDDVFCVHQPPAARHRLKNTSFSVHKSKKLTCLINTKK